MSATAILILALAVAAVLGFRSLRQCPSCGALIRRYRRYCPSCRTNISKLERR